MALQIRRGQTRSFGKMIVASFAVMAFVLQPLVQLNMPAAFAAGDSVEVTTEQQLRDAVADASINNITLNNITLTQQLTISRSVTLSGGTLHSAHDGVKTCKSGTIFGICFAGYNYTNDSVVTISGSATSVKMVSTVVDGQHHNELQGIQVYGGATANLSDVTVENNSKAGLHVNGSTANVNNITTKNNGNSYGGIAVSNGGVVTITGQSSHSEPNYDVYKDILSGSGEVNDSVSQYTNHGIYYTLKSAPATPAFTTPTPSEGATLHNDGSVTVAWNKPSYASSFNYSVDDGTAVNTQSQSADLQLASGTHTIKVQSQALSGLTSEWSEVRTFTVDMLPTLTVDTPSENGYVSTNAYNQLVITGSFTDDHKANYANLQLVKDGNPVAAGTLYGYGPVYNPAATYANADGSYTFNLKVPAHLDGEYHLFYTGTDFTGGVTERMERTFLIDNFNPTLNVTAPAASNDWQYINKSNGNGTLHVAGDVDSNISGTQSFSVSVGTYVSTGNNFGTWVEGCNNLQKTGTADTFDFSCDVNLANLNNGKHVIRTTLQDNAGNWSAVNRYINVDKTVPTVPTFTMKDNNGDTVDGHYINTKDFSFDLSSSTGVVRYQLRYSNTIPGATVASWNTSDIAASGHMSTLGLYTDNFTQGEGVHSFQFSACDAAGNCSDFSSPFVVTYDNSAPHLAITNYTINGDGTYTVSGTTDDDAGVTVMIGLMAFTVTPVNYEWSVTTGAISDGTYDISASSTDAAGNVATVTDSHWFSTPLNGSEKSNTLKKVKNNTQQAATFVPANTNGQVLGAQDTNDADSNGVVDNQAVKGVSTTKPTTADSAKSHGFAWYWWLILLAAVAILWWIIAAARRRKNEA